VLANGPVQADLALAGGGNSAGHTALHLAKWADRVTLLVRAQSLTDSMSDYLIHQIGAAPNVDVCYHVQVAGGAGAGHLESLVLQAAAPAAPGQKTPHRPAHP
jgi:thioredoxin reductase (NADPH)